MNRDVDKSAKTALRSHKPPKAQQLVSVQKKKKDPAAKDAQSGSKSCQGDSEREPKSAAPQGKRPVKVCPGAPLERPGAQRKLSDASNASEDLSKDSGCPSGKLSSSDSSSEISDCPSEGNNKHDSPSGDSALSWIDGGAYLFPDGEARGDGRPRVKAAAGLSLFNSTGSFMDLMMGETTEDVFREVEDLRSENEYLKVGKSVSLRLYNELEAVQKKDAQLEWENEVLREKTQELEVARQVLQAEVEKSRESTLKKKSSRSSASRSEKRLSQQIEDDSADLRCQLHFAKEELALMCKKLTKLVSESEVMREELAKYHSACGDLDTVQSPPGRQNSAHAREAGVRVHLKLVEEEAMLLSRRIVELEMENRGLRAEMSDLRGKMGRGGGEEEEEEEEEKNRDALEENLSASTQVDTERSYETGCTLFERCEESEKGRSDKETSSQTGEMMTARHITREGPVGGEWDPSESHEIDNSKITERGLKGLTVKDYETLLALRDHSSILSSAIQLLTTQPKSDHRFSTSSAFTSTTEVDLNDKAHKLVPPSNEALELLQAMLLAFIGRVETLLTGDDFGKLSLHKDGHVWDSGSFSFLSGDCTGLNVEESQSKQEFVEDLRTSGVKEREKQMRQTILFQSDLIHSCRDPKMRLCLQVLWILHQWCQVQGPGLEGKDNAMSVLWGLLQKLDAELRGEGIEFNSEAKGVQGRDAECGASVDCHGGADRTGSSKGKRLRRQFSPRGCKTKNWCYLSQEAAQLDREDPVKTWDHLIMPLSFPDLDFERMSVDRSHTAPEKSAFRIYYSPPSARRVQLAQQKQSPVTDGQSVNSGSPWCTPPTSFSPVCLGSAANLSDDMKEMTASWRQTGQGGSQEQRGRSQRRWVDVACSGTQTHSKPQMVSVGLQTDGSVTARSSPSRLLSPSLVSARLHHISTSLDGGPGRVERARASASSPKFYRRHSVSGASSPPESTKLSSSSSSSSSSTSRDRAIWSQNHSTHNSLKWTRQTSSRSCPGLSHNSLSSTKSLSGKPAGANRYGMVTEFLRRVSGRAEKTVPVPGSGSGQKTKNGRKNLERVPTRPPAAPLHRNDSVTRIVNQRFMKQREEAGRAQREERGSSLDLGVRGGTGTVTAEDGNYERSSSSTLTFCFARPSRSSQRQTSSQSKLQRHRYSPPSSTAADSNCE
uniref:SOGA coiled-coil domain-containing protein n=1 Tax=Gasterosteus aculeatus aculeatus TaxID=481459 RepID=A0AAQ4RBZ6_GASAC